jgi:entericidin A
MKKIIGLVVLIAATYVMVGCNTVNGLGKDIEKVGDKMQEKSAK